MRTAHSFLSKCRTHKCGSPSAEFEEGVETVPPVSTSLRGRPKGSASVVFDLLFAAMNRGPVIIEAAINGNRTKEHNPNVPRSHEELVADTLEVLAAGASIVHNHGSVFGDPRAVADDYLAGWMPVFAERPDALLYPTANYGDGLLFDHLPLLAESGGMKITFLDPGSVNLGGLDADGLPVGGIVHVNSFDSIASQMAAAAADRLGPSFAIYEPGFLRAALTYWREGRLPQGSMFKFYLAEDRGYMGAPFGLPPTRTGLDAYLELLGDCPVPWALSVVGGDPVESGLAEYAIELGGHLQVGLEFYGGDRQPTNAELTHNAAEVCARMGVAVATCGEAAEILGLPRR